MGKKATKAADNMYYLARCEAAEKNDDFSSREKAAEMNESGRAGCKPCNLRSLGQLSGREKSLHIRRRFGYIGEEKVCKTCVIHVVFPFYDRAAEERSAEFYTVLKSDVIQRLTQAHGGSVSRIDGQIGRERSQLF